MHTKRQPAPPPAAGQRLPSDLFIGRPHGGGLLLPAAVPPCVHFPQAILFPSSRTPLTPPQSGSGRKEQTRSKADKETAGTPLRSACSIVSAGVDNAGSRGKRRSAAGGGTSEAVSRKRRDWRARRGAGIALPRRWISPCGLGESKGGRSSAKNGPLSLCAAAALRWGFGRNF